MPIYEYRCNACGSKAEFIIGPGEEVLISCPGCGSSDMEKVMSAASFLGRTSERIHGRTCCGREERCDSPPCSTGGGCSRDERT